MTLVSTASMAAAPTSQAGFSRLPDLRVDDAQVRPVSLGTQPNTPKHEVSIGRLRIEAGKDAPPLPDPHPLIVFSHGSGGWSMSHWKTARYFARRGCVVLALIHDNADVSNSRSSSTLAVWQSRPKEWSAALDTLLASQFAVLVDRSRIVAMGFSAGGYTALTVGGARPSSLALDDYCRAHSEQRDVLCLGLPNQPAAEREPGQRKEALGLSGDARACRRRDGTARCDAVYQEAGD
ncbi:alpha/beta hydrolase family protein [Verminephrobacter eiseniae]|uniref:alpha/beta hydrolase family protein n=1 Tax=Verminephrobacter eiseniae TaxID=364317 RepID=UPI0000DCCBEA|nr:hypothetical protein [Verminephrobacter eiseniae]